MYRIWYIKRMPRIEARGRKRLEVAFFRTSAGGEPVRDWLKSLLPVTDRKQIGTDIKTLEYGWPIGMPVCRLLGDGLYEVRSSLERNRIARVIFYIDAKRRMVLLHAFIKKTQKTSTSDLDLARRNKAVHENELRKALRMHDPL